MNEETERIVGKYDVYIDDLNHKIDGKTNELEIKLWDLKQEQEKEKVNFDKVVRNLQQDFKDILLKINSGYKEELLKLD